MPGADHHTVGNSHKHKIVAAHLEGPRGTLQCSQVPSNVSSSMLEAPTTKAVHIRRLFLVAPKHSLGATLYFTISVCVCVRYRHCVQKFEKYGGIELQMSEQVVNTLPFEPFRTFNVSDYFTK